MAGRQTVIYAAGTMQEAHLLRGVLAEAGIRAWVTNDVLQGGSGVDVVGWVTLARVVVADEDAETARRIALHFDGVKHELPEDVLKETGVTDELVEEAAPEEEPDDTLDAWPRCPRCGEPRPTRCPICGTVGTDFPQADSHFIGTLDQGEPEDAQPLKSASCGCASGGCASGEGAEEPEEPLEEPADVEPPGLMLMCPTCDEPFAPEFPRRCAWCEHEFEDGFEVDQFDEQPSEEVGGRVMLVVFCLMALLLAVLVYFVLLVR